MHTPATRPTALRPLRGMLIALVLLGVLSPGSAQAATKPAWCPSALGNGVAVEFGPTKIIPAAPIDNTYTYSEVNTNNRVTPIKAVFAKGWTKSATMSVQIGAEYGFSPVATVKAQIDTSVTASVSNTVGLEQELDTPIGRRLRMWWSVDLRQTTLRYDQYNVGCRLIKRSPWIVVTAPRLGTVKPQHDFVR